MTQIIFPHFQDCVLDSRESGAYLSSVWSHDTFVDHSRR